MSVKPFRSRHDRSGMTADGFFEVCRGLFASCSLSASEPSVTLAYRLS